MHAHYLGTWRSDPRSTCLEVGAGVYRRGRGLVEEYSIYAQGEVGLHAKKEMGGGGGGQRDKYYEVVLTRYFVR